MTDVVPVEDHAVHAPLVQFMVQGVSDGTFPRAAQACKPDDATLVTIQGLPVTAGYLVFMPGNIRIVNHLLLLLFTKFNHLHCVLLRICIYSIRV